MNFAILLFTVVVALIGVEGTLKINIFLTKATGACVAKGFSADPQFGTTATSITQAQMRNLPSVKSSYTSRNFEDNELVIVIVEKSSAKCPLIPAETFEGALVPGYDGGWGVDLQSRNFDGKSRGDGLKVGEFYLLEKDDQPAPEFKRVCSAIIQGGEHHGKTVYIYTADRSNVTLQTFPRHYGFLAKFGSPLPV